ncbi:MAG: hypothetical protein CEN89_315 [Candidatus Berkelbacteria bacterium Licking1014_7]|uniref:Uncharacterized protein n=1 Tax=Candidatus Berkelbacteria bacterium Licking1014_7 TaxID=2017147 RepID=A0A554LJL7_9BACT|nr:MAG: hypothetical protein CEN89_315 [Candidatus Berkelbacteria bacterium Licking1014_7]
MKRLFAGLVETIDIIGSFFMLCLGVLFDVLCLRSYKEME